MCIFLPFTDCVHSKCECTLPRSMQNILTRGGQELSQNEKDSLNKQSIYLTINGNVPPFNTAKFPQQTLYTQTQTGVISK